MTSEGSVATFSLQWNETYRWTQLSSQGGKLLKCKLSRRSKLLFADHVHDFDTIQSRRD